MRSWCYFFFDLCVFFIACRRNKIKKQSWSRSIWSYHTNPAIYMLCLICGCNTRSRSPSPQLVSSFISSPFSDETMNVNKIFKYVYDIPFALNFRDYVIISILHFQMTFILNKNVITSFCVCVGKLVELEKNNKKNVNFQLNDTYGER